MAGPRITVTCDCGAQRRLAYGEAYICDCGRRWTTSEIPADEYGRVAAVVRRYRMVGWAFAVVLALVVLLSILTAPRLLLAVVPATLMVWAAYLRPVVRRRYARALADLTKSWPLQAPGGR